MAFLLHHIEKLVLGCFLLGVLGGFGWLLSDLKTAREEVAKIEGRDPTAVRRKAVETIPSTVFDALEALQSPGLKWGQEGEQGAGLFIPMRLIRCANPECGNILPFNQKACPFCGQDQGPLQDELPKVAIVDRDQDGMSDEFEYQYDFLDPKVAGDAERDHDGDYFTNLEEFEAKTDPSDKTSHPPLARKLRLMGIKKQPFPISFTQLLTNDSQDKSKWDIAVTYIENNQRQTPRLRLGESALGYKLISVTSKSRKIYNPETLREETNDVSELVLQKKDEDPVTLVRGEKAPVKATFLLFAFLRDQYEPRRTQRVVAQAELGFELTGASGEKEEYVVKEVNDQLQLVIVARKDVAEGQQAVEVTIPRFDRGRDFKRRKADVAEGPGEDGPPPGGGPPRRR